MKKLKKIMTLLITAVMMLSMSTAVFADVSTTSTDTTNPTVEVSTSPAITVKNLRKGDDVSAQSVKIYQVYNYDADNNWWSLTTGFAESGLPNHVTTEEVSLNSLVNVANTVKASPNSYKEDKSGTRATGTLILRTV